MDGRRALVIDDEVHFRYFLRVLLEKAGFAVKMARNGIEALDVLRSWRPDVITMDVMMPEQSGLKGGFVQLFKAITLYGPNRGLSRKVRGIRIQ